MATPIYTKSQTATYMAHGSLDKDVSKIVTNITPARTPFLTAFKDAEPATELKYSWFLDELHPPQRNAHTEMEDYRAKNVQGVGQLSNNVQRFRESVRISDDMMRVKKLYDDGGNELSRQMGIKMKALAQDMEMALVHNVMPRMDRGEDIPALTGGVPYFMAPQTMEVTFAGGIVSIVVPPVITPGVIADHGLSTGDFIMFKAGNGGTLPGGVAENTRYYVRLTEIDPSTSFTLHMSLEDAVYNHNQFIPADDGAGQLLMVKNNIIDCNSEPYTEKDINDATELLFYRGGNATIAYMSSKNKRRFTEAMHMINTVNSTHTDTRITNTVTTYIGDFGTIEARVHPFYPDHCIDIMDMSMWNLKWLLRPRWRDMPLKGSYTEKVIEATMGLKGTQPLASARILNVTVPRI